MFYVKNVPVWERMLRILVGVALIACSVLLSNMWATIAAVCAGVLVLTGLFGFCPMCALVGRKIKS